MPSVIMTKTGYNKIQQAIAGDNTLKLSKFIFADSTIEINEDLTSLDNIVYESYITYKELVTERQLKIQTVIPAGVGGFNINRLGVIDNDGELICVGEMPNTYMPDIREGTTKEVDIKLNMYIDNATDIEILVDPTITLVTQDKLNKATAVLDAKLQEKADKANVVTSVNGLSGEVHLDLEDKGNPRGSTYVIANYDSKEESKVNADYVIELGEDASSHIEIAAYRISQTGGEIKLMEGKYNIRSMVDIEYENITLSGIPHATVLVQHPTAWAEWDNTLMQLHKNSIVRDLIIEKSEELKTIGMQLNDKAKALNIDIYNAGNHGFYLKDKSEAVNCKSIGAKWVSFYAVNSTRVVNCIADSEGTNGYLVVDDATVTSSTAYNQSENGFYTSRQAIVTACNAINCNTGYQASWGTTVVGSVALSSHQTAFRLTEYFNGVVAHNIARGGVLEDNSQGEGIFENNIIVEEV